MASEYTNQQLNAYIRNAVNKRLNPDPRIEKLERIKQKRKKKQLTTEKKYGL